MDNDIYGHVNNVTYYSYFDTVANRYLIDHAGLDIQNADIVGFVVASKINLEQARQNTQWLFLNTAMTLPAQLAVLLMCL